MMNTNISARFDWLNHLPKPAHFTDSQAYSNAESSVAAVASDERHAAARRLHLAADKFSRQQMNTFVCDEHVLVVYNESQSSTSPISKLRQSHFTNVQPIVYEEAIAGDLANSNVDLVILDNSLGQSATSELLVRLNQNRGSFDVSIIVITDDDDIGGRVDALNRGASDAIPQSTTQIEFEARIRNALYHKIQHDRIAQYSLQLESEVYSDPLTQAANRRAFDCELNQRVLEWQRYQTPLGLLMIDIDKFKSFNDRFGHLTGDDAIVSVSQNLKKSVRDIDVVARYGGEEFAVILPDSSSDNAKQVACRIQNLMDTTVFRAGDCVEKLTVSSGVANALKNEDAFSLVKRADTALYAAKKSGRNRCFYHDGETTAMIENSSNARSSTTFLWSSLERYRQSRPVEWLKKRTRLVRH